MTNSRHLRNAPITEALIDFRVKTRPGFRVEEFERLKDQLSSRFPETGQQHDLEVKLNIIKGQPQPPVTQEPGLRSYLFRTADGKTIAQFRADGFTFNRLRPYTSWEEMFPQALELWSLYCSVSQPEVATRLAVRYINRIELPAGPVSLEKLLRAAPVIPAELPQTISGYLLRMTIHDSETAIAANVAQALEAGAAGKAVAVILDIDAFMQREFGIDDPAIRQTLGQLRDFKNRVFFNVLTEEMLRSFE